MASSLRPWRDEDASRSAAVLQRLGFRREGLVRRYRPGPTGRVDRILFSVLPDELVLPARPAGGRSRGGRSQLSGVVPPPLRRDAPAVRFSRHAKNEMRLYRIAPADVEAVVAAPAAAGADARSNSRLTGPDANGRAIIVVVAYDDPDFVITTFPDN